MAVTWHSQACLFWCVFAKSAGRQIGALAEQTELLANGEQPPLHVGFYVHVQALEQR